MAVSFKKMILFMPLAAIAAAILFVLFIKYFAYSTPIPASNEKEKAYYEKRTQEWEEKKQREEYIK